MESKVIKKNGNSFIQIDDKCYEPCMFRSFRPTPANVSLFHRNGIKLYQMLVSGQYTGMDTPYSLYGPVWIDKGEYDFAAFDRQMNLFKRFAPNSYYCIFIQLDTPQKWIGNHAGHKSSFDYIHAGMFDEEWKKDASEYVNALIEYAEKNYGDSIFGYAFCAGRSCEWFAVPNEKEDVTQFSQPFAEYCKDNNIEYNNYFDTWDDIWKESTNPFYDINSAEENFVGFGAENLAELVTYFSSEIQKTLKHKKILGTFFGYHCMKYSTNFAYLNEKVYSDPNIDVIFSPAEYDEFREIDGCSGFQLAVNSLELNNKLYLHEIDHRTNLALYPMEHGVLGRSTKYRMKDGGILNDCYDTEYEGVMVLRRELALTMLGGNALWWFDFFGGYYASPTYEKELRLACDIMKKVYNGSAVRKSVAQIALIVDNGAFKHIRALSDMKHQLIRWNLLNLGKAGTPFDIYNVTDMEKIDFSNYKLVVFMDLFEISEKTRLVINEKLKNIHKLWMYAPGYINNGKFSSEGISNVTNISVSPYRLQNGENACAFGKEFEPSANWSDTFEVTDDSEILGTYTKSGKTMLAKKGYDIYSGAACLPTEVWRGLAQTAGVHMYTDGNGALIVNNQFVCYENNVSEHCRLVFEKDYEFEELFDGGIYKTIDGVLEYQTEKGRTKLFYIKN